MMQSMIAFVRPDTQVQLWDIAHQQGHVLPGNYLTPGPHGLHAPLAWGTSSPMNILQATCDASSNLLLVTGHDDGSVRWL